MEQLTHLQSDTFPDVILSDLKMPSMDGIALIHSLKQDPRWREIPVVIYTSSEQPDDREKAMAAGCAHFLGKDPDFQKMKKTMAMLPSLCGLA